MDLIKAKRIEALRVGPVMHSWRRISEIICEEFPDEDQELHGNQLHGVDLCKDAMMLLHGVADLNELPDIVRERWDT